MEDSAVVSGRTTAGLIDPVHIPGVQTVPPSLADRVTALEGELATLKGPILPVGAILPFNGTMSEAEAQKQNGWWVCDGRPVNDASSVFDGKPTPNLVALFLYGAATAGPGSGQASFKIPDETIETAADNWRRTGDENLPPSMNVIAGEGWRVGGRILTHGTYSGVVVPTTPPYYSVIYLIKVR
jgi:hypothetical protein